MCGLRPVTSTRQNVISRGLSIFGSFFKPLRSVVTETFAEASENWEVSSNLILTDRLPQSFINVKLMMYGFRPVSSTCQNMKSEELPIFRKLCKPLRDLVTKTFQSCSQQVRIMGVCKGVMIFLTYDFCYLQN